MSDESRWTTLKSLARRKPHYAMILAIVLVFGATAAVYYVGGGR